MRKLDQPHYTRWLGMMRRCYHPKNNRFQYYGARGIVVCPEWHVFKAFQKWCLYTYEPGTTLDRIDVDGDYEPSNCRWATYSQQRRNSRKTQRTRENAKAANRASQQALAKIHGDPSTRREKICARCANLKPLEMYHKSKAWADGHVVYCKPCTAIIAKAGRERRKEVPSV